MSGSLYALARSKLLRKWRARQARLRASHCLRRLQRELTACPERKIRVAFLVVENQKWSAQSVYDAMAESQRFDPLLLASTHVENTPSGSGRAGLRTALEENIAFAHRRGLRVEPAYDRNTTRFIPLSSYVPDIVFYEQPYGLPAEHCPATVSRFALTCYIPYGYGIYLARNSGQKYQAGFSEYIWKTFVESEDFLRFSGNTRLLRDSSFVPTGYPKMDCLRQSGGSLNGEPKEGLRPKIVFAPHHAIDPHHQDSYGTFPWSGLWMLEQARARAEIKWVLKPHPKLKDALVQSGVMAARQVDEYFHAWETLENAEVVTGGDYIDAFMGSDALITDSGSFLMEYMLTGSPILLLVSSTSAGYSEFGERVVSSLYKATRVEEISGFIDGAVLARQDSRRNCRKSVTPPVSGKAGRKVKEYLESRLLDEGGRQQ